MCVLLECLSLAPQINLHWAYQLKVVSVWIRQGGDPSAAHLIGFSDNGPTKRFDSLKLLLNLGRLKIEHDPARVLGAQLDLLEQVDSITALVKVAAFELHSEPSSIAATKFRIAHSQPRYTLTAADVFNRSFGVITTAAN